MLLSMPNNIQVALYFEQPFYLFIYLLSINYTLLKASSSIIHNGKTCIKPVKTGKTCETPPNKLFAILVQILKANQINEITASKSRQTKKAPN